MTEQEAQQAQATKYAGCQTCNWDGMIEDRERES